MSRLWRWLALGMALLLFALAVPQFTGSGPVSPEPEEDCAITIFGGGVPSAITLPPEERRGMYLCFAGRRFGELPPEELIAKGMALCDSATREEELVRLLEMICPGLMERNEQAYQAARDQEEAEERDRLAAAKGTCPRPWQGYGRTGVVEFFGDGGEPLGDVTVGGPGRYRLRAYVRSGAQPEVLIMAWPLKR
ncbi:hypothetical protein ACIBG7_05920 [Nonomuraea sp. NPDC050328]|uniref:hypothetical protein n=1 Tax=Nonomuraea sp. NPDC050328 TaxID=3364361 RepID=UPI003796578E